MNRSIKFLGRCYRRVLDKSATIAAAAAAGVLLIGERVFATTAPTTPDLGVDIAGYITSMGTDLGGYIGAAVGLTAAVVAVLLGVSWLRRAGR